MNQFLNERQFVTPSHTPLHKFKSELPPSLGRAGQQGQTQTLILNINGTTNINNFHTGPTHGPSASLQQVDKIAGKNNRNNQTKQSIQGRKMLPEPQLRVSEEQETKKYLLPKKLLKQAKSAKNARITPKCIMQKTLKAAMEAQTGRVQQNKNQFDFNFKNKIPANNVTIDYDQLNKKKMSLQSSQVQNKTQNLTLLQQKAIPPKNQVTAKSNRSMAQTKQSKTQSKRTQGEVKKMSNQGNRPKTMVNNLLKTHVTRAGVQRNPQTLTSSIDVEKENFNVQNYSNDKKNGLSISSFSSRSNKGRQNQDAIADQLSKNYFLNSKQLLNHLSPTRITDGLQKEQPIQASGLSQQTTQNIRRRTRSIAVASSIGKPLNYPQRKNHSQSQSRAHQQQQLQAFRNVKASVTWSSRQENEQDKKPKQLKQPQLNKKAVDKLIKDNIRKNKIQKDEQQVKKQMEQYRMRQKKVELTQRNQEVRMINASKIINPLTGGETTLQIQSPVSNMNQRSAIGSSNRRRSQSCFDYQALKRNSANSGNSHSGSRKAHHSQENKNPNYQQNLMVNQAQVTQPLNRAGKPRSFVDEITKLTQLIEQEIGPSSRIYSNNNNQVKQPKRKRDDSIKIKKSRPSVEIQRFIERKKRDELVKKSLEMTIEVDKQNKIQYNLNTLDKYVKKGIKTKGQAINVQQKPIPVKSKSQGKRHKRSTAQKQDTSQIVGLSEIFYQNYKEDTSPYRGVNEFKHQTPSVLEDPSIYVQTQYTQKYPTKNSHQNSGKQSFQSNTNYPRKEQNNSVSYQAAPQVEIEQHHKKKQMNKSFVPLNRSVERPPQLTKKHPALQQVERSPKSNQQIRRIHEFVALYKKRCVLKPGVSDASVMGTLHSAASVIQIHFRYFKRMRDAGLHNKPREDDVSSYINSDVGKTNENQLQSMGIIDVSQMIQNSDHSDFINTTDKRGDNAFEEATIQNEDYWQTNEQEQYQQAFNQRASLDGLVIGSVFSGSAAISGQHTLMPSPPQNKDTKKQTRKPLPQLDVDLIEESNNQYHQQPNSAFGIESQNSGKGQKTPLQVPGLDLRQLSRQQQKAKNAQDIGKKEKAYENGSSNKIEPSPTSQDPGQTASSYSGIFNRLGLPLPRSARVKVEYSLVQKDPKISEQLKEIVELKGNRGKQIMREGFRDNLISERTYEVNRMKLDKWVNASYNKIDDNQVSRRSKIQTQDELVQAAVDGRARLSKIINNNDERQSARSGFPSGRSARQASVSGRGVQHGTSNQAYFNQFPAGNLSNKGENFSDRDPYSAVNQFNQVNNQNIVIGSARQHKSKLVELINRDSSRTSSKAKREQSASGSLKNQAEASNSYRNDDVRLDEIELHISEPKRNQNPNNSFEEKQSNSCYVENINQDYIKNVLRHDDTQGPSDDASKDGKRSQSSSQIENPNQLNKELGENHQKTEKSLNRSQSYHTIPKDLITQSIENLNQYSGYDEDQSSEENNIVYPDQIEIELEDALRIEQQRQSPDKNLSIEALRDPRFFMRQVDEVEQVQKKDKSMCISQEKTKDQRSNMNDDTTIDRRFGNSSYMDSSAKSPQTHHRLIKVENQQYDDPLSNSDFIDHSPPRLNQKQQRTNLTVDITQDNTLPIIPVSPVSDQPIGFESKIQTGAHSLSSTDSDMAKAIHAAHKEPALDSPPHLISPKAVSQQMQLPLDSDQSDIHLFADQLTDYLFNEIIAEANYDMDIMIPRQNLPRQKNSIKFFEKKGIKTDLFAIEKYVDEVLEEVKVNRPEFMTEINRPLRQDAAQALFSMQNSEIGTYEHFQVNLPPVLSLDLYLKLEKRRKESREVSNAQNPDGRFDFEKVNEDELVEDGVDKNFLAECQHIHNKVLFDCINDSLQQFRPHGKDGAPMAWSRLHRKLKPTEDFTLEEMFEITKHDLFRMAIMQAGTLPRREFVFGGHFDEDLFAEIREKKLATLLCREIVDNEPQWLKWDFEEAQTKIDIADMVLESLVTETIGFLTQKSKEINSAQAEFEKIELMLKSKS